MSSLDSPPVTDHRMTTAKTPQLLPRTMTPLRGSDWRRRERRNTSRLSTGELSASADWQKKGKTKENWITYTKKITIFSETVTSLICKHFKPWGFSSRSGPSDYFGARSDNIWISQWIFLKIYFFFHSCSKFVLSRAEQVYCGLLCGCGLNSIVTTSSA